MKSGLRKILYALNIVLYFTCLLLWLGATDNLVLNLSASVFTVVYTLILFITDGPHIRAFLLSRFSKRFYSELTGLFLIAAILAIINYLSFKNYKQWDISDDQMNSLSEQSRLIAEGFKTPVKATIYAKRDQWDQILNILSLYHQSNSKIEISAVDIELEPQKAKSQNLSQFPALLIENGPKKKVVLVMDELSMTNGFLSVQQDRPAKIYYTTGHGELDANDTTEEGASVLITMLKNSNMEVEAISLMKVANIPEDASALLSLGPQDGFLPQEIELLKKHLENGGRYILTVNPDFKADRLKSLREMLIPFGVKINNDIVLDRLSSVHNLDATIPIVEKYDSPHAIMKNFKGTTIYPMSSSLELVPNERMAAEALVKTSLFPASWAEKNLASVQTGKVTFDEGVDNKGPINLAVVSYEKARNDLETKIAVFGSSSLIVNGYANQSPNFNLFLNAVAWVVGNEGLISLNRPVLAQERIMMSDPQVGTIFYFSVIFLPLALFSLAFYLYRRRLKL